MTHTCRTLHLTTSSTLLALSLAVVGAVPVTMVALSAPALGQTADANSAESDIGLVVELRHQQAAQYYVDHALELSR